MMRRGLLLLVFPAVLALAACGSPAPVVTSAAPTVKPTTSATPSATPTPTPTPVKPVTVDPAGYLIDGAPGTGDQVWSAIYGFYTDASKAVRCDFYVSSEAEGYAACQVMKGHETEVTYDVPSEFVEPCDGLNGFEMGVGVFQLIGQQAGFAGCREIQDEKPTAVASTKVIPNGGTITVKRFSCSVLNGVATCTLNGNGPHFVFGLSVADFAN